MPPRSPTSSLARGHAVEVVVTADAAARGGAYPIRWVRRSLPNGVRQAQGLQLVAARGGAADVVYTTGLFGRASLAAELVRTPYVIKLTGDSAYERAVRFRLFRGTLEEFQETRTYGRCRCESSAPRMRAAPRTSSARARTSARSCSAGASGRSESPCCRTPCRRCPSCPRGPTCGLRSTSAGPCSSSPAG